MIVILSKFILGFFAVLAATLVALKPRFVRHLSNPHHPPAPSLFLLPVLVETFGKFSAEAGG